MNSIETRSGHRSASNVLNNVPISVHTRSPSNVSSRSPGGRGNDGTPRRIDIELQAVRSPSVNESPSSTSSRPKSVRSDRYRSSVVSMKSARGFAADNSTPTSSYDAADCGARYGIILL
jgi:hypothetical protein